MKAGPLASMSDQLYGEPELRHFPWNEAKAHLHLKSQLSLVFISCPVQLPSRPFS